MSVSKFIVPADAVNGNLSVLARIVAIFAPHEADPAAMSVVIDPGHIKVGATLTEVGKQLVTGFVAPTTNPRIDRIVVGDANGVASILIGSESTNPVPPTLSPGQLPVAQVALVPGVTAITNNLITDERDFNGSTVARGALINVQRFTASGVYTPTAGSTSVIVEALGGGAGGGGAVATGDGQMSVEGGGSAGAYGVGRLPLASQGSLLRLQR